jgi:uncharacterized protein (DUF924 family)
MDVSQQTVHEVLTFWYGQWPFDQQAADQKKPTWFQSSPSLDQEIQNQFELEIEHLLKPPCSSPQLVLPEELDKALAIILLLDQFTRNIYRGNEKAFAGDNIALDLCKQLIDKKQVEHLPMEVAAFACMPLQHSEDADIQLLSIKTFDFIHKLHGEKAKGYADFARIHKKIIDEFGRYPHRNQALGRVSTDAEQKYLEADGHRFGQ